MKKIYLLLLIGILSCKENTVKKGDIWAYPVTSFGIQKGARYNRVLEVKGDYVKYMAGINMVDSAIRIEKLTYFVIGSECIWPAKK
jgi:hypothetical protein